MAGSLPKALHNGKVIVGRAVFMRFCLMLTQARITEQSAFGPVTVWGSTRHEGAGTTCTSQAVIQLVAMGIIGVCWVV